MYMYAIMRMYSVCLFAECIDIHIHVHVYGAVRLLYATVCYSTACVL